MGVYSVCRALFSVIFYILSSKLLFLVFHSVYHIIDTLENRMEELLEETLPHLLLTRVDHLVDEHNPLAIITLWVVNKIGEVIVSVLVYTGVRIGLHVLEKVIVNPVEIIRESVVDPIKGFVLEKSREYENVFKQCVVAPIGDYAVKNITKYVLPYELANVLVKLAIDALKFFGWFLILTPSTVLAPILGYICLICPLHNVPAPIQKCLLDVAAQIRKYVPDVAAQIRKYELNNLFNVLYQIAGPSPNARLLIGLFIGIVLVEILQELRKLMFPKLAQIQRRLRILHDIRKMKDFRYQFENLRNMTEVVRRLVVVAEENSEAIQSNAETWLTSVKQIIESSNLHGFEEVEKLYSERLEQNFPGF